MKKLIISNFIFLIILNTFFIAKEFMMPSYSGSRFDDFTYTKLETEGAFGYGILRISVWWPIYFLLLSLISAYIFKYLKLILKKVWLLLLLVSFQIFLCYWINRLIFTNIFGFFQIENILLSVFSIFIFWYFVIRKNPN